jgi:hypothetical protein
MRKPLRPSQQLAVGYGLVLEYDGGFVADGRGPGLQHTGQMHFNLLSGFAQFVLVSL